MTWIDDLGLPPIKYTLPQLANALTAASAGSEAVMKIYESGKVDVASKPDDSPVTKADILCNQIMSDELAKTNYAILSEESIDNKSRLDAKLVWIIDPLDGTSDFVDRTGEFTIMIGLAEANRPILGIIVQPTSKKIFVAQDGAGAFVGANGIWNKIRVHADTEASSSRAVCSRHHFSQTDSDIMGRLGITDITKIGSSIKACSIASGDADIYLTTTDKMSEWDTCASWCIITEAGGRMTDTFGQELMYNSESVSHKNGIIASAGGRLHELAITECKAILNEASRV